MLNDFPFYNFLKNKERIAKNNNLDFLNYAIIFLSIRKEITGNS